MSTPARIRNADAYRDAQPDLDIYNPCFEGYTSSRFCGSDVDGLFVSAAVVHGMWERNGHLLFLEHKAAPSAWCRGQWVALNQLAAIGRKLDNHILVVVTYGEPDSPNAYQGLPLEGWQREVCAVDHPTKPMSIADVETVPMRMWIKWVAQRSRGPF